MAFIELKDVMVIYKPGTPYEAVALENINLSINKGEFLGIIGPTGSGKSTLVQLFNGLIMPHRGKVLVDGIDLSDLKGYQLREIRRRIGLVFQYPENQLFGETVAEDIAFGPRNLGFKEEDVHRRVKEAMEFVGLDYESFKDRSPFTLSGGEMRRTAIAGILAMGPEVLVLDEPSAGMDPRGRREILSRIAGIHKELKIAVVLVSHNMDDIARFAQRVIVLNEGKIVLEGTPQEIFSLGEKIRDLGLDVPPITELVLRLKKRGINIRSDICTVEEAREEILRLLGRR
ncbi:MAG TPA: energy-coupling factor transporter ATPase [Peptococcaceae bacterium]|nr:MAG: ATPase component of general energizing module of ECF transporter [Clostridia bacterium 41_269]HBT20939.1 energy-coupling factor transporter ATPase [Peptococcaceae bacterium]